VSNEKRTQKRRRPLIVYAIFALFVLIALLYALLTYVTGV
jgi:hypothetical protein